MREEDGRRRRKADTELKTKTPHVNVGKNVIFRVYVYVNLPEGNIWNNVCKAYILFDFKGFENLCLVRFWH